MLEALEDRQLLSSGGVISSITEASGNPVAFKIGTDGQVYELNRNFSNNWQRLSYYAGTFKEVSAALDNFREAYCYAINTFDGHLWELAWHPNHGTGGQHDFGGVCAHISATANNECYVIGGDHSVWLHNDAGFWTPEVSYDSYWGGAVQISAGVDRYGQDKVYALSANYHDVLEINHDGSMQWLWLSNVQEISAGIGSNNTDVDLYYIQSGTGNLHWTDGIQDTNLYGVCLHISATVDQYGNRECYAIGTGHDLHENNGSSWFRHAGGNLTQISAAANDMVYAVRAGDQEVLAYDPDYTQYWGWWDSYSPWHDTYGRAAMPTS
jgi:hypothetical protein